VPALVLLVVLLLWVSFEPLISHWVRRFGRSPVVLPEAALDTAPLTYRRILVPLDHSDLDRLAVSHAAAMARLHGARLYLVHVEEGVTSQVYGSRSSTAEVAAGQRYLEEIGNRLKSQGLDVETVIAHSSSPKAAIVRCAREIHPDLVIMGAHGHGGLKDLIFGTTIDPVRHNLDVPVLIVSPARS